MTTDTSSPGSAREDRGDAPPVLTAPSSSSRAFRALWLTFRALGRSLRWCRERDLPYKALIYTFAAIVAGTFGYYLYVIVDQAVPGWQMVGLKFFYSDNWNFQSGDYGALGLIIGTLLTTALALLIAVPIGIGCALGIVYVIPRRLRLFVSSIVELLAVVPSIVYGLWGALVLAPWLDHHGDPWLQNLFHGNWPFNGTYIGLGLLLGMIVLSVMILPTIAAISRDVLLAVPQDYMEGGLSVGATKGQVIRKVILPTARAGLFGAVALGTARALGETIALFLILGNPSVLHPIPTGAFSILGTIATEIAQNVGTNSGGFAVLCCLGMVLMVIVGSVNLAARLMVRRQLNRLGA